MLELFFIKLMTGVGGGLCLVFFTFWRRALADQRRLEGENAVRITDAKERSEAMRLRLDKAHVHCCDMEERLIKKTREADEAFARLNAEHQQEIDKLRKELKYLTQARGRDRFTARVAALMIRESLANPLLDSKGDGLQFWLAASEYVRYLHFRNEAGTVNERVTASLKRNTLRGSSLTEGVASCQAQPRGRSADVVIADDPVGECEAKPSPESVRKSYLKKIAEHVREELSELEGDCDPKPKPKPEAGEPAGQQQAFDEAADVLRW